MAAKAHAGRADPAGARGKAQEVVHGPGRVRVVGLQSLFKC